MLFKEKIKSIFKGLPLVWAIYIFLKANFLKVFNLRMFLYDAVNAYKYMHWNGRDDKNSISAELLFQYHKLEKGLVMPGKKRFFGVEPAKNVMRIIQKWENLDYSKENSVYLGAIGTLQSYYVRVKNIEPDNIFLTNIACFLEKYECKLDEFSTPINYIDINDVLPSAADFFDSIMVHRRSVREFTGTIVDNSIVMRAIRTAQLSPSACNRQPCKISIITDEKLKRTLLLFQNGNKGFGHLAPHIAVIVSDEKCFFGATERHEPYIDGGLFSMSFILALKANGVDSCCLNWCVKPNTDKQVHDLLGLDRSYRIIMLVAFGYAPTGVFVPRSPRKDLDEILLSSK